MRNLKNIIYFFILQNNLKFIPLCLSVIAGATFARTGITPDSLPIWKGGSENHAEMAADSTDKLDNNAATEKSHNLQTNGSKSLQTSIGNGGADVQQELRLSIQGNANENIFVNAYLVDVGRPAGSEITATLRETDAVYIGIEGKNDKGDLWAKGELGDINVDINNITLWNLQRSTLGARGTLKFGGNDLKNTTSQVSTAYGTDKTTRQSITFNGNPSQQKGYLLFGDSSAFGNVVPRSERVFLNGTLLTAGKDYQINDAGGVIDFLGTLIPSPKDEIIVEFDSYGSDRIKELRVVEENYRSKFLWLDLAAFNLRDSLESEKRLGLRARAGGKFLFGDVEAAMNENEDKAFKWFFVSDSNSHQKQIFKLSYKGAYLDSGFRGGISSGGNRTADGEWDNFILRDKWLLDSVSNGNLRYDEAAATLKFGNWSPGVFAGHRNFESVRGEGFLKHETESANSEFYVAKIKAKQKNEDGDSVKELWQSEIQSKVLRGTYRPYGNFRIESDSDYRSIYGIEFGEKNQGAFALSEVMRESEDSAAFSQWKNYIIFNERDWRSSTLFQIRRDKNAGKVGEKNSYLLDQIAAYNAPNSIVKGEINYTFNYTNEIPLVAIYRKVPSGAGDVLYDSITGQYISGVDNGDFVYEGMGRSDSMPAKRAYKNHLRWDLTASLRNIENGAASLTAENGAASRRGFLEDISLLLNGEYLLHSTEKLLDLENSILWEHPKKKGSLMLTFANIWSKDPQTLASERINSQTANAHYTARENEDWNLIITKGNAEYTFSDLKWDSWAGEMSLLRTLVNGFSVQPFYSQKYTEGLYFMENWNALLRTGGINGKWQNERGSSAQVGVSGNFVEKSGSIAPYSAVDGFESGFSWRANALAQIAFGDHFYLSAQYVARMQHGSVLQKLTSEAKAVF